jgi:hypothetical protein
MMSREIKEKVRKYADMAHASARASIDDDFEIKFANLREQLGVRGLSHSSVMDCESARLHADRVKVLVQARADALIEGFELYGTLDEEAGQAIIEDVSLLHQTITQAIAGTAKHESEMRARRTNSNDPGGMVRAQEFGREIDRLSTPILNAIACQIERRRLMPGDKKPEASSVTNVYHVYGHNPRWNVQSTDQSVNVVTMTSDQLFVQLREQIKARVPASEEQTAILARVDALEQAQNTTSFAQKYAEFIAVAANHMQLIAPFIPALTEMLYKTLT